MFYYFGRKGRLAQSYPAPQYSLVVEPFAGSMAYSLHWKPDEATGYDIDPVVAKVWNRVSQMTLGEITDFYPPRIGQRTTDRWAMMAAGSHGTSRAESYLWTERMARDFEKQRRLALRNRDYSRAHVTYNCADYHEAPDVEVTWFIDPPYQHVRRGYERDNIDYGELAEWCMSRRGQVIVCEQAGADWLPFQPLREIRGTTNKLTTEVVWLAVNREKAVA